MTSKVCRKQQKEGVGSRITAVLKELFGWADFPTIVVLFGLVIFLCAVFPAKAQGGGATLFVPSNEGVEYPSIKVLHPAGTDAKKVKLLKADLEKVGLQVLVSTSPPPEECQVAITNTGYRFVCFAKSTFGEMTCKIGPIFGSRSETVELLGLYYRACPEVPRKPWS